MFIPTPKQNPIHACSPLASYSSPMQIPLWYVVDISTQHSSHESEGVLRIFIISTTLLNLYTLIQCSHTIYLCPINHSFSLSYVEPEEDDVSVLYHVLFALLHVFSLGFAGVFAAQSHQVVVLHDFGTDEAFFEVGVDDSCGLRGFSQLSDGPASHLVGSRGEIVDEIQGVVARLDDLGDHGPLLVVLVLELGALVLSTVGNDLSRDVGINVILDLFEPLVLLGLEVRLAEVDQVNDGFGSDEAMGVEQCDLSIGPFSMSDPFVLLQDFLSLHQDFLLLSCFLRVGPLNDLLQIFQPVGDVLEVLEDEFGVDDLHISDGVD